jgi:hypothetical protein
MRQRLDHCGRINLAWTAAVLAALECGRLLAQEPPLPTPAKPADAAPAASPALPADDKVLPGEALPKLYYLPDKDGKLLPVPGFTWERFFQLHKLQNGLDEKEQPPAFSIPSLLLSGTATGQQVNLTADFTVAVHESGWVRVPLRLASAVLREPAKFDGPGEHETDLDADGGGYVAWIRSEPGTTHRVQLQISALLVQTGSESHLQLTVPRATLSQLKLQVPVAKAIATISEGSQLESVTPAADGGSLIAAAGLRGEFDLAWHAAESQVAQLPTVLDATGAMLVRIDGRTINTDAKLTVRSSGGEFDRFQVRLPPGADFVPTPQTAATVTMAEGEGQRGKLCNVQLARKTAGPVEVRLVTQRAYQPSRDGESLELGGFEVVDAVRQFGTMTVQVTGNWQVQWGEMRHIRQTDEVVRLMGQDEPTAAFEYTMQPFSLVARVKPQETRIRVAGDYVILVSSEEAELRATLRYTVRGAKVRALEVDAPGWDVDLIGPGNLVNVDAVAAGQNSPLVIPLLQATSGDVEVTFAARQEIAPAAGKISLRLPVPRGQSVSPANVTIVPADNVELLLETDETVDLASQSVRPRSLELPERQQEPLYLRTVGDSPTLVASIKVHQQEITSALSTQLEIDELETLVDERLTFQVSYEPTDHVLLGVPRGLRADALAVTLDGQRLTPSPLRERGGEAAADVVPMRCLLPAPRIGRLELQIKFAVPHSKLASQANTPLVVPLVIPAEGVLTANDLLVVPRTGITATYPKGPWTLDTRGPRQSNAGALALSATSAIPSVLLAVSSNERQIEQATTIEQAWIQSRLTASRRQDRAVYRLSTSEPSLRLVLPAGAELATRELQVDGRPVQPQLQLQGESRELVIPLGSPTGTQRIVELRYHFAERPAKGDLVLEPPRFRSVGWVHQLYWELVLPSTEHVLGTPADFAREYRWAWSNLFWQRRPSLDERDLENWIGAAPSANIPPASDETGDEPGARRAGPVPAANRYLFSTIGAPDALRVHTLGRSRLVLLASLAVLACGLALIYLPALRHPAALLVAAVAIAAAGLIDPESGVLIAQAASLGLLLVLVAYLLARISGRPKTATAPVRGSSQALERPYSETYPRGPAATVQPSTATNPFVPAQAPESTS